jgi:hypothetical protein
MNRIEILTQEASFFGNKNNTYLILVAKAKSVLALSVKLIPFRAWTTNSPPVSYLLEIRWQGLVGPAATDWKKEYLKAPFES